MTGHAKVDQLAVLNLQGNIIPHTWFQKILMPSGKVDLNGIIILSEIVYWYRPTITKNEDTGHVTGYNKRFKSDMLQRSYDSFANQFGLSKRQVTDAIKRLEDLGLIQRIFRNLVVNGTHMSNVLHIDINAEAVIAITNNREYTPLNVNVSGNENSGEGVTNKSETSHEKSTGGVTNKSESSHAGRGDVYRDYSEITTEITQIYNDVDNSHEKSKSNDEKNPFSFFEQNGFGILTPHIGQMIDQWIIDLNQELVLHAMKIAVENGVLKWNYVNKILLDWSNKKYQTIKDVEAAELQRQKQFKRTSFSKNQREELLPDWFTNEPEQSPSHGSSEEVERMRQKLIEEFKKDEEEQ